MISVSQTPAQAGKRVWTLNGVQLDYVLARGADGIPLRKSSALFERSLDGQTTQVCDLRAHQNGRSPFISSER